MSNWIYLNSIYRNRTDYPSPADYTVDPKQLVGWFKTSRTTSNIPPPNPRMQEYVTSVTVDHIVIPYDANLQKLPYLYLDVHSQNQNDSAIVATIGGTVPEMRFLCEVGHVQFDNTTNTPLWMHLHVKMDQQLRLRRDLPLVIRIYDDSGITIFSPGSRSALIIDETPPVKPDIYRQTHIAMKLVPYVHDGSFDNQLLAVSQYN